MNRTDTQYHADREIENTPEPQPCEICGTPTHDPYWTAQDEPRTCCSSPRCERRMWELEIEAMWDADEDSGRDE